MKKAVIGLAKLPSSRKQRDPYWHVREKAIGFASQQGWEDIIKMFEKAQDSDNRKYVFYHYSGDSFGRNEEPQLDKIFKMLDRETHPENLYYFLSKLHKHEPEKTEKWVAQHAGILEKAMQDKWHGEQLRKKVELIKNWSDLRKQY